MKFSSPMHTFNVVAVVVVVVML